MSTLLIKGLPLMIGCSTILFSAEAQRHSLDSYIAEAFRNNQGLQAQQFQWQKSLLALQEARSLFLPSVSFLGDYTKASGGRSIDIPTGDLLNPVYNSLNQLTGSSHFPNIPNSSIQLNPDNFYDAKIRTSIPLVNAELYYNCLLKKESITQQEAATRVYKRELVQQIKEAYFRYYQAEKAELIYRNTMVLLDENIRVNQSLLKNGVRNSTALTRSLTEKQKTAALLTAADNNKRNVLAYFNFLLNRSIDSVIVIDTLDFLPPIAASASSGDSIAEREELKQIRSVITSNQLNSKREASFVIPKLNSFLDLGSQGFNFAFNSSSRYYLFGINLQWDLFAGGQHKYRIREANTDVETWKAQYAETEKLLRLQLTQSLNNLQTAISDLESAKSQCSLADKYYRDQLKVYKEGQLLYLELVDALNQLTQAQIQIAVSEANLQIAYSALERTTASYPLSSNN